MFDNIEEKLKDEFDKEADHPLQTWEWGEFRKKTGNIVLRLGKVEKNKIKSPMQLTIHPVPVVNSFKIATLIKGPKPDEDSLKFLSDIARKENFVFIKMEPNLAKATLGAAQFKKAKNLLRENGCVKGKTLFTPSSFWIDLTKDEDTLIKSFHSKTRYNIRYAQKKGVKVEEDNSDKAFDRYIELTRKTVERQGFYAHTEAYHRLMWETLHKQMIKKGKQPIARLLTASYKGEILTTWIVFIWKNFLYYPYGASSGKHKNLQANSIMMWEAIKFGKEKKLKTFDLWGREPGKGFTRFKEGFNPRVVEFLGTWDLVTSPLYYPYRIAEGVRWSLLKLRAKLNFTKTKF
jgi:lipid II:glycine glycyltransferase (peptidoglycan interpeptide bridge formation enzyme)